MPIPFEKSLPFTIDGAYNGFASVSGMLHIDPDHLILEFEVKDILVGALKSGAKEVKIPYDQLSGLYYQRNLFKSRLQIKVKSLRILSRVPGAKDGKIVCKIKRSYKERTEDIVHYANLRIAEKGLDALDRQGPAPLDKDLLV